jgi:hypothetical protein
MARRNVFICDGDGCGAVLIHPEDGFVFYGVVRNTDIEGPSKTLITIPDAGPLVPDPPETVLCTNCCSKRLGLDVAKPK